MCVIVINGIINRVKEDHVDHVVFPVVMTGGEKMQDSGTQSENLQVNTGCCQFTDTHQVSVLIRLVRL